MRFLKDMLARKAEYDTSDEAYDLPASLADLDPEPEPETDLWDEADDAASGALMERLSDGLAPGAPEAEDEAGEDPVEATVQEADPEGDETQDAAPTSRPRSNSVNIWDLFDDDEDEAADATDAGAAPDHGPDDWPDTGSDTGSDSGPDTGPDTGPGAPAGTTPQIHCGDVPPEPSQNELAREAMQVIRARAFEDPGAPVAAPTAVGRAKTRVLGFASLEAVETDPFAQTGQAPSAGPCFFPVGWIVVIDGPGRGATYPLQTGVSQMGRGEGQSIQLNFGDTAISRTNHASIAYDEEQNVFYIGHGGKANIVRLNGRPVLSTEELTHGDLIRIGETTLRFVSLCGPDFAWDLTEESEHAVG